MSDVDVIGATETQRRLRRIGTRGLDQSDVIADSARATQRSIEGVPVRTGRLDRSVHGGRDSYMESSAGGYVIGSSMPYARFVFRGTRHMRAQPPRIPSSTGSNTARRLSADLMVRR
jgi:hypothetical protein